MDIRAIIKKRKSVRTFNKSPLSKEDREKLTAYLETAENPFGVPVEFRFLNAKAHGLSSPVIVGADEYVAAKVRRAPQYEIAYGYSFEAFCLYAEALGLGTVMLAGTLSRKTFERAMELEKDEVMPVASPVGYPAEKRSVREKLMRKAVKADDRLPFEKLFFANSFSESLKAEDAGKFRDALEAVRLAPSAVNKQPWRAVVCGDTVHFFKKGAKMLATDTLDLQKVDMGIALAHFDLTLKESGAEGRFVTEKPAFETEDGMEYIISYEG